MARGNGSDEKKDGGQGSTASHVHPLQSLGLLKAGSITPVVAFLGMGEATKAVVSALLPIAIFLWDHRRKPKLPEKDRLPKASPNFSPFESPKHPWPRTTEAHRLIKLIHETKSAHVVVTGSSGAGKSVLVDGIVTPLLQDSAALSQIVAADVPAYKVTNFDRYSDFVLRTLDAIAGDNHRNEPEFKRLRQAVHAFLHEGLRMPIENVLAKYIQDAPDGPPTMPVEDVVERYLLFTERVKKRGENYSSQTRMPDEMWLHIKDYLKKVPSGAPRVLVFDQIERLIHHARLSAGLSKDQSVNGYEILFFLRILRHLREDRDDFRTIFVIRAEYLFNANYILGHLPAERATQQLIKDFICTGINLDSDSDGTNIIQEHFKDKSEEAWQGYVRVNGLDGRAFSNTFFAQLSGYMIELYLNEDKHYPDRVRNIFENGQGDRKEVIKLYFEKVFDGYSPPEQEIFKAVMFTIAVENRVAGLPISRERVCHLSHLPQEQVDKAIRYAESLGLIRGTGRERMGEDQRPGDGYRIVHDIVADFAIESEDFAIEPRLKDSIRGLAEARAADSTLTPVARFPNIFRDVMPSWVFRGQDAWTGIPNVGAYAIWAFYVHGLLLLFVPNFCLWTEGAFTWVPLSRNCETVRPLLYSFRFVMEAAWVAYIYVLARAVFYPTTRHGVFLRSLSWALPTVGAILGIIFSHSPILFLVPLNAVGFMMAGILMVGAINGTFVGRYASECWDWGLKTLLNMLFTVALMLLTAVFLEQSLFGAGLESLANALQGVVGNHLTISVTLIGQTWYLFANGLMVWFLLHISKNHQGQIAVATRLALFDRTRHEDGVARRIISGRASAEANAQAQGA